ncbi:hypothetical protein DPMN_152503 [Dreissena polymorpha]|uniref:Uncharacterized protein n=1 Tax=Dreissena polymorpha TaxID=45954 RepID=A0A9D4FLY1_DREPO|nr:hypothetical protein DPMN_152503 [Dreissena polymorpha]
MMCIISILPSVHVSSNVKKYEELLKLLQDPEKCDRLTDTQSTNHKSLSGFTGRGLINRGHQPHGSLPLSKYGFQKTKTVDECQPDSMSNKAKEVL